MTRRLVSMPTVAIAAVLAVVVSPLTVLVSILLGSIRRPTSRQPLRVVALVTGGLVIELIGMVASLVLWVVTGFGLVTNRRWAQQAHARLMGRYTRALLWLVQRVTSTTIQWRVEPIRTPVIMLARHTSFFDALIPATILCAQQGLVAHHVITAGLRWGPAIDVVGHRIPTVFLDRTAATADELGRIAILGHTLRQGVGAVIFPEGTFRTPRRFERAIERLRERDPALANRAARLHHVLPTRPAGTYELLRNSPEDTSIVTCANTGLEGFGTLQQMRRDLRGQRPVVVETWECKRPAPEVLADADAFGEWLLDQFETIDRWVENELAEGVTGRSESEC